MVRLTQNSFLGGQLDYEMMGRQDFAKYAKGASKLENFNILKRGALDKRHGFDRMLDLTQDVVDDGTTVWAGVSPDASVRLVPFAYKKNCGFVLVFADGQIAAVSASTDEVTGGAHALCEVCKVSASLNASYYTADEIQELDYQQCGDVMYIAHRNHPPAKIVHDAVWEEPTGQLPGRWKHTFTLSRVAVNPSDSGIPTIRSTAIKRMAASGDISASGTSYATYKATAVFASGETLPSAAYKSGSFYLPWTESQSITVKIRPQVRVVGTSTEYPSEIRVYKKAFNYYGLIGVVKLNESAYEEFTTPTRASNTSPTGTLSPASPLATPVANGNSTTIRFAGTELTGGDTPSGTTVYGSETAQYYEGGFDKYGSGGIAYSISEDNIVEGRPWKINLPQSAKDGRLRFGLGYARWTEMQVSTDAGDPVEGWYGRESGPVATFDTAGTRTKAVFDFTPNKATRLHYFGDAFGINSSSDALVVDLPEQDAGDSYFLFRLDGETDQEWEVRRNSKYAEWLASFMEYASLATEESAVVRITGTGTKVLFWTEGGDFVVNHIGACGPNSLSEVSFVDDYITPDSGITPPEKLDDATFSGTGNYPGVVTMTQQRLVWASSKSSPARIWMSQVGDFENYDTHEIQRVDDAIDFIVPITRFNSINHMVEMRKLLMFNSACEWMVDSSSTTSGLTYETIQAYPQSYSGSNARLKPLVCGNSVVFCERSGQSVRRFAWDLTHDGYAGRDVSILACSIFEDNPITDWTYQQFPLSLVWCVLYDGRLATLELMEEQDIIAWATHRLGHGEGNEGMVAAIATTHALAPFLDDAHADETTRRRKYDAAGQEEVYAAVRRGTVGTGGSFTSGQLWLERMRPRPRAGNVKTMEESVYHSLCMDSVRVLNRANGMLPMPSSTVNAGLVYVRSDLDDDAVAAGTMKRVMTRDEAVELLADETFAGSVYEGFPYKAEFQSVFPVFGNVTGTGQMDIKDIGHVALRLMHSCGGTVRATGCNETEPIRYDDDPGELKHPTWTGGVATFRNVDAANVKPVGINTRDGRFHVEQSEPWPFTILMYELDVELEVASGRR